MACSISQKPCSKSQKACSKSQSPLGFLGFSGNPKKHNNLVILVAGRRSLGNGFQLTAYGIRSGIGGMRGLIRAQTKKPPASRTLPRGGFAGTSQQPNPKKSAIAPVPRSRDIAGARLLSSSSSSECAGEKLPRQRPWWAQTDQTLKRDEEFRVLVSCSPAKRESA